METDVLIVGAGLAGLSLADQLDRSARDFHLIEARERIGGRILSEKVGESSFDLGPAWFWPGQRRLEALTKRFELTVFEQYASGSIVSENQHGEVRRGAGFASMQGSYRLAGGLSQLTSSLARGLQRDRLQLNARLVSIIKREHGLDAVVHTSKGAVDFHAKQIVLALPPRLVSNTVQLSPDLPHEIESALSAIPTWMAGQAKIVAVYDRPYWREAGLSGDAMSQFGPMVEIHDASPAKGGPFALFGFVGVPADIRLTHKEELRVAASDQLRRLFGESIPEPLEILVQDWAHETYTSTGQDQAPGAGHPAYAYPEAFRKLWGNSLILSSTEVAPQFGGYLEGALEAAENAFRLLN